MSEGLPDAQERRALEAAVADAVKRMEELRGNGVVAGEDAHGYRMQRCAEALCDRAVALIPDWMSRETLWYALRYRGHCCGPLRYRSGWDRCRMNSHDPWCECSCLLCRVARLGRKRAEKPPPTWARERGGGG